MTRSRKLSIGGAAMVFLAVACEVTPPPPPQPRPPVVTADIAPQTVHAGESVELDLAGHFSDPDGEALTYRAAASDPAVAGAAVGGSILTITGVAPGTADVTVTATDPGGLSAEQAVGVTVPNRPPAAAADIGPQTVNAGESVELDLAGHFSDPDGEALTYRAAASDPAVAGAAVGGSILTITGVAPGTADVTVTATDPGGLSAEQAVGVTVPNRPPAAAADIAPQTVNAGESVELDLVGHFSDPDGEALTYRAATSDPAVAGAAVAGSTLTLTGVAPGTAEVTVTATDPGGLSAEQAVRVRVSGSTNLAPVTAAEIAPQTIRLGIQNSAELDLAGHFSDPDGDALTYRAEESDPYVLYVTVAGSILTIIGVHPGTAEVTVTATDPGGLSAEQTVPVRAVSFSTNLAPVATANIGPQTVRPGVSVGLDLAGRFSDPDGDTLTYRATTSDPDVAGAAVAGSILTITGVTPGTAEVGVDAADPGGLSAAQAVRVTVVSDTTNLPPVAPAIIGSQTVRAGKSAELDLARFFSDPDGDALTYRATTSDPDVAGAAVAGSILTITGVTPGTAEVGVEAADPHGLSAAQAVGVRVLPTNLAPVATANIAPQAVRPGESVELDLAGHFSDPDGDALTYRAAAFAPDVAGAAVAGSILTITGVTPGITDVGVEAADPHGLFASQAVFVWVTTNLPPVVTEAIARQTVDPGESVELDLARYFSDPDDDMLTYSAGSSPATGVTVAGATLTVTGVAPGYAGVAVRATDPEDLWVDHHFYVTVRGEHSGDQDVLKRLYHATGGPNWTANTRWLVDSIPLNEWHGVEPHTQDPTAVDALWLTRNYLMGPIPPELGQLSQATEIDLGGNYLTGPIPPELGNLAKVKNLFLYENDLTGPIPPELGNLGSEAALRVLHLDGNKLTGPVPRELANHRDLYVIRLNNNRLTGRLPAEFTSLVGLRMITWHDNDGLCVPRTAAFDAWLSSITFTSGPRCESSGSDR